MLEEALTGLERAPAGDADCALALEHAPRIRFDAREPFLPLAVGYTVFRQSAPSPSFPRAITLDEAAVAIEYAIWWDWDIQHLYELEHIWVYLDAGGRAARAEASWHGGWNPMLAGQGRLPLEGGRLTLFSEPGKHAFAPSADWLLQRRAKTDASCGSRAGKMGVHVTPLFEGVIQDKTPRNDRLVHSWLERRRFQPSYDFSKIISLEEAEFAAWSDLREWIPNRVSRWLAELEASIPYSERRILRIAHRGASAYARENTRDALRVAAEMGADMAEIDIRVSADDIPVVAHDSSLKRVFGLDGGVADYTLEELRRMGGGGAAILTFEEALVICRGLGMGLYLDIKRLNVKAAGMIFAAVEEHQTWRETIFASFRPDYLADIKAACPRARTSILFSAVTIDPVKLAGAIGADYVHPCWEHRAPEPHRLLRPEWLAAVRAADLGVVCWHEERRSEIAALKALGVDAICSDAPDLLRQICAPAWSET